MGPEKRQYVKKVKGHNLRFSWVKCLLLVRHEEDEKQAQDQSPTVPMFRRPPPPSFVMWRSRTSEGLGTYGWCVGTNTCNRVGPLQQDENNTVYIDVCFHVCMPHAARQFLSSGSGAGLVTRRDRSLSCSGLAMNVVHSLAADQSIALPKEGISLNIPQYAVSRRRYDTYRSRSTQGLLKHSR
jgi:hypothetical protein